MSKRKQLAAYLAAKRARERGEAEFKSKLTSSNPATSLPAIQVLLEEDASFGPEARRLDNCSSTSRCHSRLCAHCAVRSADRAEQTLAASRRSLVHSRAKDPQARARQIAAPFHTFKERNVSAVTINFEAIEPSNVLSAIARWRSVLRDFLRAHLPTAQVEGRFETIAKHRQAIRDSDVADRASLTEEGPDDVLVVLHAHLLMHTPDLLRTELAELIKERFGFGNQVRVLPIVHTIKDGVDVHGIDGVLGYGAKGFIQTDQLAQAELDEIKGALKAQLAIDRRKASFSFGTRTLRTHSARAEGQAATWFRDTFDLPRNWHAEKIRDWLLLNSPHIDLEHLVLEREDLDSVNIEMESDYINLRGFTI